MFNHVPQWVQKKLLEHGPLNTRLNTSALERNAERVSGAWVFKGTRIPVLALFENIEAGASVDNFVEWFPGVSKEQVLEVLRHTERSLEAA